MSLIDKVTEDVSSERGRRCKDAAIRGRVSECVCCWKGLIVPMLWLAVLWQTRVRLAEGTERPFIIQFC